MGTRKLAQSRCSPRPGEHKSAIQRNWIEIYHFSSFVTISKRFIFFCHYNVCNVRQVWLSDRQSGFQIRILNLNQLKRKILTIIGSIWKSQKYMINPAKITCRPKVHIYELVANFEFEIGRHPTLHQSFGNMTAITVTYFCNTNVLMHLCFMYM